MLPLKCPSSFPFPCRRWFRNGVLGLQFSQEKGGKLIQSESKSITNRRCLDEIEPSFTRLVFADVALRQDKPFGEFRLSQVFVSPQLLQQSAKRIVRLSSECFQDRAFVTNLILETQTGILSGMPSTVLSLLQRIIADFYPRFVNGGRLLHAEGRRLRALGPNAELVRRLCARSPTLMPAAVFVDANNTSMVLCDSAPHRQLIHDARKEELSVLFRGAFARLVFVSAIKSRADLASEFPARETAVWVADEPDHLIHFSSRRLLGSSA